MITYKGQKTVIGKKFIYEGEILKYIGKIYGDSYNFVNDNGIEYILSESELDILEEYSSPKVNDIKGNDTLKKTLIEYTERELNIINDLLAGKTKDRAALNELYEKEINDIQFLNKYDLPKNPNDNISLEAQKSYLDDLNRNISNGNIVSLLTSLNDFIASNKKGGEDNGNN